jgi:hypothetical protein
VSRRSAVACLLALAALLLPAGALAAQVDADASDYPLVRATVVTDRPTVSPPVLPQRTQRTLRISRKDFRKPSLACTT